MAERRSLHSKVSHSTDMLDLIDAHGPYAALFVTWAIPHLDRYGCLPDDARKLRVIVLPLVDGVSNTQVGEWVEWLVDRGMVVRVTGPNGDRGIQFTSFQKHQGEARLERERRSLYEPEGWLEDPSERARRQRAEGMRRHRNRDHSGSGPGPQGEGLTNQGDSRDLQGTPGPLPDHSDIREVKLREEKRRTPPYPPLNGGSGPGPHGRPVDVRAFADQLVEQQLREEAEREETHE